MKNTSFRLISFLVLISILFNFSIPRAEAYPELWISQEKLNFGRCTKDSIPVKKFTINNIHDKPTKVTLTPSQVWIHLSVTSFEAISQEIEVKLDPTNLSFKPGLYLENIKIESDVCNLTVPIRLDLVEKKVTIMFTFDNPLALVDGKEVLMEYPPFIYKGKILLPIGIVCQSFGANVIYDGEEKTIDIEYKDIKAFLRVGDTKMILNGKEYKIFEPTIRLGRTFLDWRVIYQIFGAKETYIYHTRSIKIEY